MKSAEVEGKVTVLGWGYRWVLQYEQPFRCPAVRHVMG